MVDIWNTVSKLAMDKLVKPIIERVEDPSTSSSMTATQIKSIVEKLRSIEVNNGYAGIAKSEGVRVTWVKEVEDAVQRAISEKTVKLEVEDGLIIK